MVVWNWCRLETYSFHMDQCPCRLWREGGRSKVLKHPVYSKLWYVVTHYYLFLSPDSCRVSFAAGYKNRFGNRLLSDSMMVFDNVISNKGGAYNNGVFVAPCSGQVSENTITCFATGVTDNISFTFTSVIQHFALFYVCHSACRSLLRISFNIIDTYMCPAYFFRIIKRSPHT